MDPTSPHVDQIRFEVCVCEREILNTCVCVVPRVPRRLQTTCAPRLTSSRPRATPCASSKSCSVSRPEEGTSSSPCTLHALAAPRSSPDDPGREVFQPASSSHRSSVETVLLFSSIHSWTLSLSPRLSLPPSLQVRYPYLSHVPPPPREDV